jgi:hypothetical protein
LDLHRASLTALANLSETQKDLCSKVVTDEKCVGRFLSLLTQSPTTQVVRECARFWSNCASTLGTKLVDNLPKCHKDSFRSAVQKLMQSTCQAIRQHARDINAKAKCCKITEGQQQSPQPSNNQPQQQQQTTSAVPAQIISAQ